LPPPSGLEKNKILLVKKLYKCFFFIGYL
jgi:hypothetical protein